MNRYCRIGGWASLLSVVLLGCATPTRAAETFGYVSRKPQLWETKRPECEDEPGTNLYWHDPLLGSWESCRAWPPAANGCAPSWYAKADMLALFRDMKDEYPFATEGPMGGTALGTGDFRSEFDAGVRVMLGKSLGEWYRLEAVYFGSYTWDDTVSIWNLDFNDEGGAGNLFSPFSDFGDPEGFLGLDYNDFASIHFTSRLNNVEFNLRRRVLMRPGCYETSFLLGLRYMDIREKFDYLTQSTTGLLPGEISSNAVAIDTGNQLIGPQIGLLSQFLIQPRCWIDFEMKGAIFQNHATLDRLYTADDGAGLPDSVYSAAGSDTINRTSFVGDISLQFNYQFASCMTFYAGYNALWVTGLALGADNFETNVDALSFGPTLIRHQADVVYHGPNLGLVFTY